MKVDNQKIKIRNQKPVARICGLAHFWLPVIGYSNHTSTGYLYSVIAGVCLLALMVMPAKANAATEYVSTIAESGGDYSTLSTWEAVNQVDLTAASTLVIGGSLTKGAIGNVAVTQTTSGATATVVSKTATQMLVSGVSGTPNASDTWYPTADGSDATNAWTPTDAGDSAIAVAKIDGTWASADTTAVTIDGWTTSSTNYIRIYTTAAARHQGTWATGEYSLEVSTTGNALYIREENVRIEGLRISVTASSGAPNAIHLAPTGSSDIRISHNIVRGTLSGTVNNAEGIMVSTGTGAAKVYNNIIYDFNNDAEDKGIESDSSGALTMYVYNNTLHNNTKGLERATSAMVAKNNLVKGSGNTNTYVGTFDAGTDYNATDSTDAIGVGSNNRVSQTFSFANEASDDFHLTLSDTGAKGFGDDLSADANLPFVDDIDGDTRAAPWEIGADEAAGTVYTWIGSGDATTWALQTNWDIGDGTAGNDGYPDDNTEKALINSTAHSIATAGAITVGSLEISGDYTGILTLDGTTTFTIDDAGGSDGNLYFTATATMTHPDNTTVAAGQKDLTMIIDGNFTLGANATMSGDELGFDSDEGLGKPTSGSLDGGGYGGIGGDNNGFGTTSTTYGSIIAPVDVGSGGDNSSAGGAVNLTVGGTTTIEGSITVNGDSALAAGSGGSVFITTGKIAGTGTIAANGGNAPTNRGAGGGGRVAVILTGVGEDFSGFSGAMNAFGGDGNQASEDGAAGTVYQETQAQASGQGTLIIDNNDLDAGGAVTTLMPTTVNLNNFADIIIRNNGNLAVDSDDTINFTTVNLSPVSRDESFITITNSTGVTFPDPFTLSGYTLNVDGLSAVTGDWTIDSDGALSHSRNGDSESFKISLTITGDLTVNAGGLIDVSGKGYIFDQGPGIPADTSGDGGSHGGIGGDNGNNGTTGVTYGSITAPTNLGSGGDNFFGGGAAILTVTGATILNGDINASGKTLNLGDGAGGSVYLTTATLTGSGDIQAHGGGDTGTTRGAGGGGRVAVILTGASATFSGYSGAMTTFGGEGGPGEDGAAGTVYKQTQPQGANNGALIIANNNFDTYDTAAGGTVTTEINNSITGTSVGDVTISNGGELNINGSSVNLNVSGTWTNSADQTITAGTVTFVGTTSESITSGNDSFFNVTINGEGGSYTLADTLSVTGVTNLTNGSVGSGTMEVQGNVIVDTAFDGGAALMTFIGSNAQTYTDNGGNEPDGNITINKTNPTDTVTLASHADWNASGQTLTITQGTFDHGASFNLATGGAVTIAANGTWKNTGTGDITLGGNVANSGTINFDGNGGGCGSTDEIAISGGSVSRNWTGSGSYTLFDLNISDTSATDVQTAVSSTAGTGNNWTINANCGPVTISGSAYQTDEAAKLASQTVKIVVGDSETFSQAMVAGDFSFASVTSASDGDIITIWLDGATEKASLVFRYGSNCTGYPNCTGLSLYQDRVILDTKDATAITNANLAACDNDTGTECTDIDIGFTSNAGALNLTFSNNVLRLKDSTADYAPGGDMTAANFTQSDGVFTGGSGSLALGASTISGGTFTASSGTTSFSEDLTITSGVFDPNGGTVIANAGGTHTWDVNVTETFNNLNFNAVNDSSGVVLSGDTLVVADTLTLTNGTVTSGTLDADGTVAAASTFDGGSATVLINGGSAQDFTIPNGAVFPGLTLNSAATTVDFAAGAAVTMGEITLQAGTFTASSGTITTGENLTITSGVFNHNGGTVIASAGGAHTWDVNVTETFNNLNFNAVDDNSTVAFPGDTLVVAGTLTLTNGRVNSGTLEPQGNVIVEATFDGGSGLMTFSGANAQTYTDNGGSEPTGTVMVNKTNPTDTVTLTTNADWDTSGQDLTITSGTLDMAGFDLTVDDVITIESAGTLTQNCGILTYTSLVNNSGTFNGACGVAALTGTIIGDAEADIVAGGSTIILTLDLDTWVADDGTFASVRQDIIDGIDSAQSETTGWNAEVRDKQVVGGVTRTSSTVVTVTLDPQTGYSVLNDETITVTVPASALSISAGAITASPTVNINATVNTIYRSVGPGNTSALATGSGNDLTIANGVATFSASLANNVGVGDALEYDCDGDNEGVGNLDATDCVIFIHGRTDNQSYSVKKADSTNPPDMGSADNDWSIFRAYTSLANAEAGIVNTGIDTDLSAQVTGGNRDLVANNEQFNLALYADAVDSTAVVISGWTTSADNYLKIYTPIKSTEVGISQRHKGLWNAADGYALTSADNLATIRVIDDFVRIVGLQIENTVTECDTDCNEEASGIEWNTSSNGAELRVTNNIIQKTNVVVSNKNNGLAVLNKTETGTTLIALNNIIYNFEINANIASQNNDVYIMYNNTLSDPTDINFKFVAAASADTLRLKNTLAQNAVSVDYSLTAPATTDYDNNISEDATSPNGSYRNLSASFVNVASDNYHLAPFDAAAKNAGADLTYDAAHGFNDDIDGEMRPTLTTWDIGADDEKVWANPAWGYRKQIVIDKDKVDSNLTDFPVLVSTTDSDLASKALINGNDIMFTSADATTKLAHEIETFTSGTGNLIAWVKVPLVSSSVDTTIYMYYGNSTASNQQNATNVWGSNSVAVWHLSETAVDEASVADLHLDSTSNNNDGDQTNNEGVVGKISGGQDFDGDDDVIEAQDSASLNIGTDKMTLSVWARPTACNGLDEMISRDQVYLMRWQNSSCNVAFYVWTSSVKNLNSSSTGTANQWNHIVSTYDGATMRIYINGVEDVSTLAQTGTVASNAVSTYIGAWTTAEEFEGILDEARIASVARSADWIKAEFNNQNSPSTFMTYQSEEKGPGPVAWYDPNWLNRKSITIHAAQVDADLTNFPMLLNWATDTGLSTNAQSDGDDILFTSSNGVTKLAHEIEKYTTGTGELVAWVKVPTISSTYETTIYMYYGNSAAANQQNAVNVWSNGYAGVWHLGEDVTDEASAAGAHLDSTSNGYNGDQFGNFEITGKTGLAQNFDGTGDYIDTADLAEIDAATTLTGSAWVKMADLMNDGAILSKGIFANTEPILLYRDEAGAVSARADIFTISVYDGTNQAQIESTAGVANDTNWHYVAFTYVSGDANGLRLYVDGLEDSESPVSTATVGPLENNASKFAISINDTSTDFSGTIDEVRMANAVRSAEWIKAEFFNQSSPTTFYTVEGEADVPADWYNADWDYRKKITVDSDQVDGNLVNFPMLVSWAADADLAASALSTGNDILFTSADGTTKLSHELEKYTTGTGELVAWVKIPALSSSKNTVIYMYYGNTGAANQEDYENVWDANFKLVNHMAEDPSIDTDGDCGGSTFESCDSTSNNIDAEVGGLMTNSDLVAAKIGNGLDFDGSNDQLSSSGPAFATSGTVSFWIYPDFDPGNTTSYYVMDASGANRYIFYKTGVANELEWYIDNTLILTTTALSSIVEQSVWTHITLVWDNALPTQKEKIYGNGVLYDNANVSITATTPANLFIGTRQTSSEEWDGQIDEFRVSNIARSPAWITTQFSNQNSPSTFINVEAEDENIAPTIASVKASSINLVGDTITITFDEPMDETTITAGVRTLVIKYADDTVGTNEIVIPTAGATVVWSGGSTIATITLQE